MGLVTEMRLPSAAAHDRNVFSYAGKHRYAVTLFTHASRPVFENAELVRTVLDVLGDSGREQMFEITAYCFVPKKLMLIIGGREETSDFRAFIRTFRTGSAARVRELMKGVLWSRRYQERVVRRGENLRTVVRELFAVPVREGLAQSPVDYQYQGSFVGMTPGATSLRGTRPRRTGKSHGDSHGRHPKGGEKHGARKPGR